MVRASIIIPAKNESNYLPRLLGSIVYQRLNDLEIIVVDANSTDRTTEIAKKFGCSVIYNGGNPAFSRNLGAKNAKSNLLIFIDADVILPKGYLIRSIREFKRKKLDVAGSLQKPVLTKRKFKDKEYQFYYKIANDWMKFAEDTKRPCMQNYMMFKKGIFQKIGGFDENLEFGEDSKAAVDAVKLGAKFRIINKKDYIFTSTRRFEKAGSKKHALKCLGLNIARVFGYEWEKGKVKYFD